MQETPLFHALAAFLLALPLGAQAAFTPAACPSTATLDDPVKAIDSAVTGPADEDRTCLRSLFLPEARVGTDSLPLSALNSFAIPVDNGDTEGPP